MENNQAKQVVLKNVRVKYAKLIRPGPAYDEGQPDLWSVNMYLTDKDKAMLESLGAHPKNDKNGSDYFVAKRNIINKKGDPIKPPVIVDGKKQSFAEEVGNGSVCNIAITPFQWEKGKPGTASHKKGILLYLNAVQVVSLVPMATGVDAFDLIEEPETAGDKPEEDDLPF